MNNLLKNSILSQKATVGVVGLGYVGLPLALKISSYFKTIAYDIDVNKIKNLKNNISYISSIKNSELIKSKKKIIYSNSINSLLNCDIIIICLPTPLKKNKPDLSYLEKFSEKLLPKLTSNKLIILQSTSYPGTTREIIIDKLKNKFKLGEEIMIGYSPEREDPGNKRFNLQNTNKLVSGFSNVCFNLTNLFYKKIKIKTIKVKSIEEAEAAKLLENIYRSVNIALINELKFIFDKMNINIQNVINAAKTKPFGFKPFYPGPGTGGHCIPIDPLYLTWIANKVGMDSKFIKLASTVNLDVPKKIVSQCIEILKRKNLKKKKYKFLLIGAAYKKNVNDCRESPIFKFINCIKKKKYLANYHDNYILKLPKTRQYKYNMSSIALSKANLQNSDFVILLTDHDYLNFKFIEKNSKLLFDCRGRYSHLKFKENIF